jgi:hypothetical protein
VFFQKPLDVPLVGFDLGGPVAHVLKSYDALHVRPLHPRRLFLQRAQLRPQAAESARRLSFL